MVRLQKSIQQAYRSGFWKTQLLFLNRGRAKAPQWVAEHGDNVRVWDRSHYVTKMSYNRVQLDYSAAFLPSFQPCQDYEFSAPPVDCDFPTFRFDSRYFLCRRQFR